MFGNRCGEGELDCLVMKGSSTSHKSCSSVLGCHSRFVVLTHITSRSQTVLLNWGDGRGVLLPVNLMGAKDRQGQECGCQE